MHPIREALLPLIVVGLAAVGRPADNAEAAPKPQPVMPPDQTLSDVKAWLHRHVPRFALPDDPAGWEAQAKGIRRRVLDGVVFRGVPESWRKGPPNVIWGDEIPMAGYVIRKLRFEALPGLWVGGLLYEPSRLTEQVPAILNVNGHVGKPGMTVDYKQARCINLAQRGMLALNLEWIGMGQLSGRGYAHNSLAYLDLCGCSGLSVFYLQLKRGLDVLCSHEFADPERIAVTGLSGGGWQTILISALDTRVKLAAPNAGYIGLAERIEHPGDIGDLEQNYTDLVSVADYVRLTALLAPRPALLIYNDKDDCCFRSARARPSVYEPIVPLYKMFGKANRFAFHENTDPGTHNYLEDNRQAFYRFLNRHFLPKDERVDEELSVDGEILPPERLAIDYPKDNADFVSLSKAIVRSLKRPEASAYTPEGVEKWRQELRPKLRELVRPEPLPEEAPVITSLSTIPVIVDGVPGQARRFRIADTWTLPVVEFARKGTNPGTTTLVISDGGIADSHESIDVVLKENGRVVYADIFLTGECMPGGRQAWKYAQMISTVGHRSLGIQVSQIDALVRYIRETHGDPRPGFCTKGRVSSLAVEVFAALHPERCGTRIGQGGLMRFSHIRQVRYEDAPSLFCFGLAALVDVEDLIEMGHKP